MAKNIPYRINLWINTEFTLYCESCLTFPGIMFKVMLLLLQAFTSKSIIFKWSACLSAAVCRPRPSLNMTKSVNSWTMYFMTHEYKTCRLCIMRRQMSNKYPSDTETLVVGIQDREGHFYFVLYKRFSSRPKGLVYSSVNHNFCSACYNLRLSQLHFYTIRNYSFAFKPIHTKKHTFTHTKQYTHSKHTLWGWNDNEHMCPA